MVSGTICRDCGGKIVKTSWLEKGREIRVCGECGLMIFIQPAGHATVYPTVEDYKNSAR